jgi:hypothetical protein
MAKYEGGCECGSVRYRMNDEPIFVNCCHCRQCQKISGSAFAINGMIEHQRLELLEGEDALGTEGGGGARCKKCRTLLWGEHPRFGDAIKFVRIGTLDESEHIKPDAHFFVRSKHPWVTIPEDLPQFEALPTDQDPPLMSAIATERVRVARGS